nr:unnamed protein product [Digitaria exilis]
MREAGPWKDGALAHGAWKRKTRARLYIPGGAHAPARPASLFSSDQTKPQGRCVDFVTTSRRHRDLFRRFRRFPSSIDRLCDLHAFSQQEFEDEYFDQDEDDLDDFIVYSDDEDDKLSKHKHQRQQELEDDMEGEAEEEVEKVEEDDVEEVEEVEEEEEAPVGQQEILSLREQLKEEIRRKNAAMAAGSCKASCSTYVNQTIIPPAKDGYGTFFGPSKPVLARRVIEEGCSSTIKELKNVPSKKVTQLVSKAQPGAVKNMQKPKFISEEKRKVDALRENRNYSSLFSDDADKPPPTKEQPDNRPTLVPKSESRVGVLVNSAGKRKAPAVQPARLSSKCHGLKVAAAASLQACDQSKAGSLGKNSLSGRERMIAAGRNGSNLKTPGLQPSSIRQKMQPSVQSMRPQKSVPSQRQQPETQSQRMQQQMHSHRPQGNGRQNSLQGRRPDPSVQRQHIGQNGRLKSEQKQSVPSSKFKSPRPMERSGVKRKSHDDDGRSNFSSIIQKIFRYDRKKYIDRDEDDRNMVVGFASIEKEERRSAALARKEDEEQRLLIEEEERRERAMKKKRTAHKE